MKYPDIKTMPFVISVEDIADTLEIGRNKAYALVSSGRIKALRLGQHYRIPRENFEKFLRESSQTA